MVNNLPMNSILENCFALQIFPNFVIFNKIVKTFAIIMGIVLMVDVTALMVILD